MRCTLVLAGLAVRETIRRRVSLTLLLAVAAVVALSAWGLPQLQMGENPIVIAQQLIFILLIFTGMLALSAAFLTAWVVSADLESGVALAMLARPLTRSQFLLGKWIGLAVVVSAFTLCSGGLEMLVVFHVVGYVPPHPAAALLAITAEVVLLMTFALLLATRMAALTAGIATSAAFFVSWVVGVAAGLGAPLHQPALVTLGLVAKLLLPTNGLWQAAEYYLEPPSIVALTQQFAPAAAANPFVALAPQPPAFLAWALLWLGLVLVGALWSMRRREI